MASEGATPRPVEQALVVGEEILRLMQPPIRDEELDRLGLLLDERERMLKMAVEGAAADRANAPHPDLVRQLAAQQRALEEQARKLMAGMQESSGELNEARNSMEAVNRILSPGVRPRWVDERR